MAYGTTTTYKPKKPRATKVAAPIVVPPGLSGPDEALYRSTKPLVVEKKRNIVHRRRGVEGCGFATSAITYYAYNQKVQTIGNKEARNGNYKACPICFSEDNMLKFESITMKDYTLETLDEFVKPEEKIDVEQWKKKLAMLAADLKNCQIIMTKMIEHDWSYPQQIIDILHLDKKQAETVRKLFK